MGVEGHGILLAVDMRRVPGRLDERIGGQAHRLHVGVGDLAQDALAHSQRKARGVIGHDVRTLADRRRGLHLGVEGRAPVERRPLNLDLARVFGVEVFDELLHADAVAAAQEVPPHDRFLGPRHARHQGGGRQPRHTGFFGSSRLPPKNDLAASRISARDRNSRLREALREDGSEESARRQALSISELDIEPARAYVTDFRLRSGAWPPCFPALPCAKAPRPRYGRLDAAAGSGSNISNFLILREGTCAPRSPPIGTTQSRKSTTGCTARFSSISGGRSIPASTSPATDRRRQRHAQGRHRPRSGTQGPDRPLSRRQFRLGLQLGGRGRPAREAADAARPRLAHVRIQRGRRARVRRMVRSRRDRDDAGDQSRLARPRSGAQFRRIRQRPDRQRLGRPAQEERPRRAVRRQALVPRQRDGRALAGRPQDRATNMAASPTRWRRRCAPSTSRSNSSSAARRTPT